MGGKKHITKRKKGEAFKYKELPEKDRLEDTDKVVLNDHYYCYHPVNKRYEWATLVSINFKHKLGPYTMQFSSGLEFSYILDIEQRAFVLKPDAIVEYAKLSFI